MPKISDQSAVFSSLADTSPPEGVTELEDGSVLVADDAPEAVVSSIGVPRG